MLSYRYMFMDMDGSRNGTDEIDDQLIISDEAGGFGFLGRLAIQPAPERVAAR